MASTAEPLLGLPDEDLPAYSGPDRTPRALTQHAYHLQKDGRTWLTLNVASRALRPTHVPAFIGEMSVTGSVQLDLAKAEYLQAVDVVLKGRLVGDWLRGDGDVSRDGKKGFIYVVQRVWEAATEEKKPSLMSRLRGREGEQLSGKRDWGFTLAFPQRADFGSGELPLPPSMLETGAAATVVYEVEIRVKRASLAIKDVVGTKVAWAPLRRPGPFPVLRQAHYDQGLPQLASPEEDPIGWTTLEPVSMSGRLFDARDVSLSCTLSLANPLTYTRGSLIPVHLVISSKDTQALDLLGVSTAPAVKLLELLEVRTTLNELGGNVKLFKRDGNTFTRESRAIANAVWWADPASAPEGERRLFGEIHFGLETTPSFEVPDVRLYYQVAVLPFSVAGFVAPKSPNAIHGELHNALTVQDVDVVTAYAGAEHGSKPLMVTPPTYAKVERWPVLQAMSKSGFF